jgi:hypothetical protein
MGDWVDGFGEPCSRSGSIRSNGADSWMNERMDKSGNAHTQALRAGYANIPIHSPITHPLSYPYTPQTRLPIYAGLSPLQA